MSIFDLIDSTGDISKKFSSGQIDSMIVELMNAKSQA